MPDDYANAGTLLQTGGAAAHPPLRLFRRMAAKLVTTALALSLLPLSLPTGGPVPAQMLMQVAGQYSSTSTAPSKSRSERFDPNLSLIHI